MSEKKQMCYVLYMTYFRDLAKYILAKAGIPKSHHYRFFH